MNMMSALLGGVVGGVTSIFTGYLFMGALFHRFRAHTPHTWRPEGAQQYALSSVFIVLGSVGVGLLFALTGSVTAAHGSAWWLQGAEAASAVSNAIP